MTWKKWIENISTWNLLQVNWLPCSIVWNRPPWRWCFHSLTPFLECGETLLPVSPSTILRSMNACLLLPESIWRFSRRQGVGSMQRRVWSATASRGGRPRYFLRARRHPASVAGIDVPRAGAVCVLLNAVCMAVANMGCPCISRLILTTSVTLAITSTPCPKFLCPG